MINETSSIVSISSELKVSGPFPVHVWCNPTAYQYPPLLLSDYPHATPYPLFSVRLVSSRGNMLWLELELWSPDALCLCPTLFVVMWVDQLCKLPTSGWNAVDLEYHNIILLTPNMWSEGYVTKSRLTAWQIIQLQQARDLHDITMWRRDLGNCMNRCMIVKSLIELPA